MMTASAWSWRSTDRTEPLVSHNAVALSVPLASRPFPISRQPPDSTHASAHTSANLLGQAIGSMDGVCERGLMTHVEACSQTLSPVTVHDSSGPGPVLIVHGLLRLEGRDLVRHREV